MRQSITVKVAADYTAPQCQRNVRKPRKTAQMLKQRRSLLSDRKCLVRFLLAAMCCCTVSAVTAQKSAEYKTSIEEIGQQIQQISRNLNANRALIKTEQDKLSDNEQEIDNILRQLSATETEISQQNRLLKELLASTEQMELTHVKDKAAL